ncbi:ino80 complex protein [Yamadazyma tenuis]|nr:ino80 complex protein [Yamadazyma tenuis]
MAHLMSSEIDADHDIGEDANMMDEDNEDADGDNSMLEDGDKKTKGRRPVSASIPKGVRYLKKSDGEPFWRRDIQYDFLDALFENDQRVFTNPFPYCSVPDFHNGKHYTFAEIYIRTLAESSKCSKILKERLLRDLDMGKSVAKVCLLVNTGRMNTTINFVPEMRSTLRTYHSIPSLQADSTTGASKPLQDTPRLKSILKAVSDVKEDFKSIEDLLHKPPQSKPNTNLVLLLFLLSNNINGIKFHHEHTPECQHVSNSFMEFFLETKIHPLNRAKRFLWLMYTYLETNFTPEELANNPFNPHEMPPIEYVPEDQIDNFDKDTDYEIEYSERMFRTRLKYLADEEHNSNPKRGNRAKRPNDDEDDDDDDEAKKKASEKSERKKKKLPKSLSISSPITKATVGNQEFEKRVHDGHIPRKLSNSHLTFPIPFMDKVEEQNRTTFDSKPMIPDEMLSKSNIRALVLKHDTSLKKKTADDESKRGIQALKEWVYKFFQYKKSIKNGLVDMEWEDLRYEIVHGIETVLYKDQGKEFSKEFEKPESKSEDNASEEFSPFYDFEMINERSQYIADLLSICKTWIKDCYQKKSTSSHISFDLDKEEMQLS